ncbi:MAG: hypothetical protein WC205_03155 [Opitutaceae bacterium]|jgi:hypothetical protein
MKTSPFRTLLALSLGIGLAGAACGQTLFSDSFETGASASNLNDKRMSDGVTTYAATYSNGIFKTREPADRNLGLGNYVGQIFVNGDDRSTYVAVSKNLDGVANYTFDIGYLLYAGGGKFGINARSNGESINGGFLISWNGRSATLFYVDLKGATTALGTVTATPSEKASSFFLRDVRVTVTGNTQQISVGGVPIGSAVPTQGTVRDGRPDQVRFYGLTTTSALDIQLDDIAADVIR